MAPIIVRPERIKTFVAPAEFAQWLADNHASAPELWLRLYKKASKIPTITYAQALDEALCWGWIDGIKKSYDETSFLQRFTQRRPNSLWSQINRDHIARLTAAGRMTEHGQVHVDAAKANGRWETAYASGTTMQTPPDLLAAIAANPAALAHFEKLNKINRYALAFRLNALKTPSGRAKKIAAFVAMLAAGETPYPNGQGKSP